MAPLLLHGLLNAVEWDALPLLPGLRNAAEECPKKADKSELSKTSAGES